MWGDAIPVRSRVYVCVCNSIAHIRSRVCSSPVDGSQDGQVLSGVASAHGSHSAVFDKETLDNNVKLHKKAVRMQAKLAAIAKWHDRQRQLMADASEADAGPT